MEPSPLKVSALRPLLEAASFAARAHRNHVRKDGQTPYVSHVFRVCLIVRHVFGIDDPDVLTAALLHDTIEDTTTDFDDVKGKFGVGVAQWVAALTKDKRLDEDDREAAYAAQLAAAPWQVKVCKLADVCDNLLDVSNLPPERRGRSVRNARRYLDALRDDLPEQARRPWQLAADLLAGMEAPF
jgi:guanosine-3',5'-bis(diphosphate) 3'-pyrophosphohydrolase